MSNIRKPKDFENLIESLAGKNDQMKENVPFQTYAALMAFAAVVGAKFCQDDFFCDYKSYGEPIRREPFGDKFKIVNLLAIYRKRELGVLTGENEGKEKISIFEGYAYAGLKKIKSIVDKPGLALDNLIDFIQKNMESDAGRSKGEEIDLSSLISD